MGQTQEHHSWLYNQLFTNWKKFEIIYVSVLGYNPLKGDT